MTRDARTEPPSWTWMGIFVSRASSSLVGWRTGLGGLARRAIDGLMGEEGAPALPPPTENLAAHTQTTLGPNL